MLVYSTLFLTISAVVGSLALPPDSPLPGPLRSRSTTPDYKQDYTTGGTVDYKPSGNTFSVDWNTPSQSDDFVVGLGWKVGSANPITYSGTFSPSSGTAELSIYGWTTDPLVEIYIIEANHNPPTYGTVKGSVTSDGSSYTIYENTRTNKPSIKGTATFKQYVSVRSSQRTSGTVTVQNNIDA